MAKIPDRRDSGQRMRGVPDAALGGRVNASDFAPNAQGADNLGRALQDAGNAMQRYGINLYEEKAQNEFLEGQIAYEKDVERYSDQVLQKYTGNKAWMAPKDIEEYSKGRAAEVSKTFTMPRAKELFDKNTMSFNARNQSFADRHVAVETKRYHQELLNARNQKEHDTVVAHPAAAQAAIQRVFANNAELYRNSPKEALEIANRDAYFNLVSAGAESIAKQMGPAAALRFFEDVKRAPSQNVADPNQVAGEDATTGAASMIGDFSSSPAFKELELKYSSLAVEAEQKKAIDSLVTDAAQRIRNGEDINVVRLDMFDKLGMDGFKAAKSDLVDLSDAVENIKTAQEKQAKTAKAEQDAKEAEASARAVLESLPDKPTEADLAAAKAQWVTAGGDAKVFDNIVQGPKLQLDADNKLAAQANLKRTESLDAEFEQAGGNPRAMASWKGMTLDEQNRYLTRQKNYAQNGVYGVADERAQYMAYRNFDAMSPEDQNELLADAEKSWALVEAMGGSGSVYGKQIVARITGSTKQQKIETPPETVSDVAVRMGKEMKNTIKTALDLQLTSPEARTVMNADDLRAFRVNAEHQIDSDILAYMKDKNLVSPNDVPQTELSSIIARNSVVYAQPGSTASDKDKAPAFSSAALASTGSIPEGYEANVASLPAMYKKNALGDTPPALRTDAGGNKTYVQSNIQQRDLPAPVQKLLETIEAPLLNAERDLGTGAIKLEFHNRFLGVTSSGKIAAARHKTAEEIAETKRNTASWKNLWGMF